MSKVLVVEDDANILLSITIRLEAAGHEVVSAGDAESALATAAAERPELVLLDVSMPAGNGFEVAEGIQAEPGTRGVPMIFMTASRRPEFRRRAAELGAVGFFEKPYDAAQLLEAVTVALEGAAPVVDGGGALG